MQKTLEQFKERGHELSQIKAIGITNQRETTVVWHAKTGKPLYNAIVWNDNRTTLTVTQLQNKPGAERVTNSCGIPFSTYFSAVKLRWLLDNVEEVSEASASNDLMFGTVDSWLVWNLTGGINGGLHITDVTNASRTMLLDIRSLQYDQESIDFFGFDRVNLPQVRISSSQYGNITDGPGKGLMIAGILGDQSAALVGHAAFSPGMAKNTYGTGCFLLFNVGTEPVFSKSGLLTTVAYAFEGQKPMYALEGSIATAGSGIQWLRDNLGLIKNAAEAGPLAASVKGKWLP